MQYPASVNLIQSSGVRPEQAALEPLNLEGDNMRRDENLFQMQRRVLEKLKGKYPDSKHVKEELRRLDDAEQGKELSAAQQWHGGTVGSMGRPKD